VEGANVDAGAAIGVDACAGGWVAVALVDGLAERVWFDVTLPSLLADLPVATTVGIDLPLGGVPAGWRTADVEARRLLGSRRSSVFLVPPRPVWGEDYDIANARCRELTGQGLSRQAYGLLARMLDAERFRDGCPHHVVEIHPELVFQALADAPLPYGKKTWNGQMARRRLLADVGVVLPDELAEAGQAPAHDVLDAAAVAWCAHRITTGAVRHVPDPADQHDHAGRPIVIHY
jgi:predicted RNase H-like nuclease